MLSRAQCAYAVGSRTLARRALGGPAAARYGVVKSSQPTRQGSFYNKFKESAKPLSEMLMSPRNLGGSGCSGGGSGGGGGVGGDKCQPVCQCPSGDAEKAAAAAPAAADSACPPPKEESADCGPPGDEKPAEMAQCSESDMYEEFEESEMDKMPELIPWEEHGNSKAQNMQLGAGLIAMALSTVAMFFAFRF